jgi:large subunit ribosomal protein L1
MAEEKKEESLIEKIRSGKHGKKYQSVKQLVSVEEPVALEEIFELLEKSQVTKFDPTVELHINLGISGIRGTLTLPGGTAKTKKVLVIEESNFEEETKKIESGKIGFDVLLVKPEMMPRLAKFAKVLGPKGLMPNPKSGTVTDDPKKASEEISGGKIEYKQDKDKIIHLPVGKLSFGKDKIVQNIKEVLKAMPANKVNSAFVNLTMGPSIPLQVGKK